MDTGEQTQTTCLHCGASMRVWKHSLTPGLINCLIKFIGAIKSKGVNSIHLQKEVELTKNEYNNFQKLHYFGLVAKDRNKPGYWVITRLGGEFLRNEKPLQKFALSFHDKLVERQGPALTISEHLRDNAHDPLYWQQMFDYEILNGRLF